MKWNFKKIVIIAAAMELFCMAAAAEELSSEEIEIIDEIVNTKVKEIKGSNTPSEIQKAIDTIYPVITKDTPESAAFIKELEEQTRKKFPASDKELEIRYKAMAEREYPIYNTGDTVTVVYLLHGKAFTVSGPYYRQDARFVWVGSKKILKKNLAKMFADRFNPELVKQLRANYVIQHVRRYQKDRENYFTKLKTMNGEKIFELKGGLPAYKKRMAARKIALEKYTVIVKKRQERFDAALKMYSKNKIQAFNMMQKAVDEYAGTPEAQNGQKLLAEWKPIIAKEKAAREAAEASYRKHQEWRENVRRRTGRYPCRACDGRGRTTGYFNPRSGFRYNTCNSCGGSGLE